MPLSRCLFGATLLLVPLLAQSPPARPDPPPGWVDGAKNPDQVPDHAAYRLVFLHLNQMMSDIRPGASERQTGRLKKLALPTADAQKLLQEVTTFYASYEKWLAKVGNNPSLQQEAEAQAMVLASRDHLMHTMSIKGAAQLMAYVEQEKAGMVVKP